MRAHAQLESQQETCLIESRDRLEAMLEKLQATMLTWPSRDPDDISDGDVGIQAVVAEHRIAAIDEALASIESGSYGTCDICGSPIAPERLRALPTARLCRSCACAPPARSRSA